MEQIYWITEYGKLLLAYLFVLFVWPSVVFRGFLKDRSRTYRFAFCTTAMILLTNTVVLGLGLANILFTPVVIVLFYGTFLVRLVQITHPGTMWIRDLRSLSGGTISRRRLALRWWTTLWGGVKRGVTAWWQSTRGKRLEYAVLLVLVAFGTLYFSWGAFDEHSYGFGDQYVHHQWAYGLVQGKAFYDGVYPEGMHCMIYLVCTCFGIRLYSGVLFFAGIHVPLLLVSAYVMMKELFRWRYSALVALTLYLTVDQLCINAVFGMSRLSWTLPLEYGLFAQYLAVTFLVRFFRRVRAGDPARIRWRTREGWKQLLRDADLLPFGLAVAVSLAVHFYVTIIAFFFCLAIAGMYLRQFFRRGSFLPLMVTVILSVSIAALPMGAAFALGYPPQGSLGWAMEVIKGTEGAAEGLGGDDLPTAEETETPPTQSASPEASASDPGTSAEETQTGTPETSAVSEAEVVPAEKKPSLVQRVLEKLRQAPEIVTEVSYRELYPGVRGELLMGVTLLVLGGSLVLRLWQLVRMQRWKRRQLRLQPGQRRKRRPALGTYDGYLAVALCAVVLMLMYSAGGLGLPQLVAGARLCSSVQMFNVMVYVCLVDVLFAFLRKYLSEMRLQLCSVALCVGIYWFTQAAGIFHGYLYFELTRYDAAVEMTNQIVDQYPKYQYTVISTTDEYYQLVETGFHEELLTLLQRETDVGYTIPTPYVFLYLEKHPIRYAQNHFADGPWWLASTKYPAYYKDLGTASQCPDILGGQVDLEHAEEGIRYGSKLSDTATDLEGRTILESKGFQWMERFQELYPEVSRVIYEDDDFVCYGFIQNPNVLFTLGIFAQY